VEPDDNEASPDTAELLRSQEELRVGIETHSAGSVSVRKRVEPYDVEQDIPRRIEEAVTSRLSPDEGDSGMVETLPDGSVSVPVFEERLVVRRELFVRERVIVKKRTVVRNETVRATLRRETIDVDADDGVHVVEGEA
jgi:uncharacterized protein (TIGR02271 family)